MELFYLPIKINSIRLVQGFISLQKIIDLANDKFLLMQTCKNLGVPVGKFFKVNNFGDLILKLSTR